jgi:protoporphyrinogen oxidase
MKTVLILGAGFAGLELATRLSEELPEDVDVTIIDSSDTFVFGLFEVGRHVRPGRTEQGADSLYEAEQTHGHIRARDCRVHATRRRRWFGVES